MHLHVKTFKTHIKIFKFCEHWTMCPSMYYMVIYAQTQKKATKITEMLYFL